jgi:hypothetical protein
MVLQPLVVTVATVLPQQSLAYLLSMLVVEAVEPIKVELLELVVQAVAVQRELVELTTLVQQELLT